MAHDYVKNVPGLEIGQADAVASQCPEDDGKNVAASFAATFEKHVFDIILLHKKTLKDIFSKWMMNKNEEDGITAKWKRFRRKANSITINMIWSTMDRVYLIMIEYWKQVKWKFWKVIHALKAMLKNLVWWPSIYNGI